ncbi:uncharacterized protein DUF4426 [Tamilnaduibacter salinus]|uniref:Uncharacterized protein DUF4426 n=1 Tax=Tamilnaduibacter salinus TaxID=1484056 RepID=A0A2A2I2X9_9GAMM|nr:DUF4426 domain-containing protein [Tamilnaduibacter salinus]PAV25450.1 hypothetical protein CF392_11090 [Tamilnaduibacter salinus]PVY76965.1 uncharacterized protein DUF4426 [Tamilnaduibacter salinus]
MTVRSFFHWLLLIGLAVLPLSAGAGQYKSFGDYQLHYSIFPSSTLQADIAKQYNLTRSRSIGVINVSLLKQSGNRLEPVNGQVEVRIANDVQQEWFPGFRRIQEGEATYYLASFQFVEGDLLTFHISATVPGRDRPMRVRVAKTLFNDG